MEYLNLMKKEDGTKEEKLDSSEVFAKITNQGELFRYADKEYFTMGVDDYYTIYACEKGKTTLINRSIPYEEALDSIERGLIESIEDKDYFVVDESLLSEDELEKYNKLKAAMVEIVTAYYPDYSYLSRGYDKEHLKKLAEESGYSYERFRYYITRFFTHGMKYYSLVSERSNVFGDRRKRGDNYTFTKKPGRKVFDADGNPVDRGVLMTDEIKEGILLFKDMVAQGMSIPKAYNRYNAKMQLRTDKEGKKVLKDASERPTLGQFRYIMKKALSTKEKIMKKEGYLGYYNNYRPLKSDNLYNTTGPGDIVEIDAWEADISLIKRGTKNQVISRPTVYIMVDRYTRMIVAFSAGYEVNSYIGLSALFLNMVEDKEKLFNKYGIKLDREKIPMPEPFIPNIVVTDNGSDFKSQAFRDLTSDLKISHEIAPPRSGSAKGQVEGTFSEFAKDHIATFEGAGLIKKSYDSKHHETATLTLDEYMRMLILAVMKHNLRVMTSYPIHDLDLINDRVELSPFGLWRYYTEHKLITPKPIIDKKSYYFALMKKISVTLTRTGIKFMDLIYDLGENKKLYKMQEDINKTYKLDFRIDPRSINKIYYIDYGKLRYCSLNARKSANKPIMDMTLREYEELRARKKDMARKAIEINDNIEAASILLNEALIEDAKENKKSDEKNIKKNIRENRKEEKLERAYEDRIEKHIDEDDYNENPYKEEDIDAAYKSLMEDIEMA